MNLSGMQATKSRGWLNRLRTTFALGKAKTSVGIHIGERGAVKPRAVRRGGYGHIKAAPQRRLSQYHRVLMLMSDGKPRTLAQIEAAIGYGAASISARLRDMRKPEFGGHIVERRYVSPGTWAYRVILNRQIRT